MKTAEFELALAELVEVPNPDEGKNPFLTMAKFVFADDRGNKNSQGIQYEDFPQVAASAIDMPVKMNYSRSSGVQNHANSIPIGHIKDIQIDEASRKLIATAMLYADEFPDEVQYLKSSFAENNAPGISWELAYQDSVVTNGVEWLKNIVTKAATFVRNPAYGSRTSLLALAESDEFQEFLLARSNEETEDALAESFSPPSGARSAAKRALGWIEEGKAGANFTDVGRKRASDLARGAEISLDTVKRMRSFFARHEVDKQAKGFNSGEEGFPSPGRVAWDAWGGDAGKRWADSIVKRMDPAESSIDDIEDEPTIDQDKGGNTVEEETTTKVTEAEQNLAESANMIEKLKAEIMEKDEKIKALTEELSSMKKKAMSEDRTRRIEAAGIPLDADAEKLSKKQDFWLSLSEEAFDEYIADLVSAKNLGSVKKDAEASVANLPAIPKFSVAEIDVTVDTLKADLRRLARS